MLLEIFQVSDIWQDNAWKMVNLIIAKTSPPPPRKVTRYSEEEDEEV